VSELAPRLAVAVGFLLGVGLGGAMAAGLRAQNVLAGRRCRRCGSSLSYVAAVPFLSWWGVRPHCGACGLAAPWLQAALETAVVLIGLVAILALPMPWAVLAAAAAFAAFVLAVRRWG
jgi:prepilin signal peptidase PulO-like enzyme (type II secretory pathway)